MELTQIGNDVIGGEIVGDTFKSLTAFAATSGGNQIVLRFNELIQTVSVECYDRYLGLLTLKEKQQEKK